MKNIFIGFSLLALAGCGGTDPTTWDGTTSSGAGGSTTATQASSGGQGGSNEICVPGQESRCICIDHIDGTMKCNDKGTGFLGCLCDVGRGEASGSGGSESSSISSSSSSSTGCMSPMHICNGVCVSNTPDVGCYTSISCSPCSPPSHATSTCTTNGLCDFTCDANYMQAGNACTCATQNCCIKASDCDPGVACAGGQCSCYSETCMTYCTMNMLTGTCIGNGCECSTP